MPDRKPDILFMGRIFDDAPWGGVREMAEELLRAAAPIAAEQGRRIEVLVPRAGSCPVAAPGIIELPLARFAGRRILWDHVTVPRYANERPNAVLYNIKLVLPEGLRIPGFTTIHDLMYFPQPAKYDWREYLLGDSLYMRLMVRRTVRRAALTHVVSQYTADDAAELFPEVSAKRFRVIHHGVRPGRWSLDHPEPEDAALWQGLQERGVRPPYVFFSGALSKRKNPSVLLRAFRAFQRRHPEYRLVLTGGSQPTIGDPRLQGLFDALPGESWVRLGVVESRELALLYQHAAVAVYPSLYEGFGLPALEAQAAGTPLVCARATSLPEVAGDGAAYFDPRDWRELARAMHRIATKPRLRRELVEAGRKNVAWFTWERTARAWLDLADEVHARGTRRTR